MSVPMSQALIIHLTNEQVVLRALIERFRPPAPAESMSQAAPAATGVLDPRTMAVYDCTSSRTGRRAITSANACVFWSKILSSTRHPELLALPFKKGLVRCAPCTNIHTWMCVCHGVCRCVCACFDIQKGTCHVVRIQMNMRCRFYRIRSRSY